MTSSPISAERLFFRGAAVGVILLLGAMVLVKLLIGRTTTLLFESYLSEVPIALPPVAGALPPLGELLDKVSSFTQGKADEIHLSPLELDTLAQAHPAYRDRVRIKSIDPQGIHALLSVPLNGEDDPKRFVAGEARLRIQFFAGALGIFIEDFLIRGTSVHAGFGALLSSNNLADDLYRSSDVNVKDLLFSLAAIELQNGEVVLRRAVSAASAVAPAGNR